MLLPRHGTSNSEVARHYGELDVFYRELWGEHVHHGFWRTGRETPAEAAEALAEHVMDTLRISEGEAVVDVGCGYGGTSRLLVKRGARVTGLTITPEQAVYARAVAADPDNPVYLIRDWLENSLPSEKFDAVVAIESTEHMADKQRCFAEMQRVLKPGGRAAVCAWLTRESPREFESRLLLEPICSEGRLAGMGSEGEYRTMLEEAGMQVVRVDDLTSRVSRTWTVCASRLVRALLTDARYRRALMDPSFGGRVFALTIFRIRAAYAAGCMRYGMFVARKG